MKPLRLGQALFADKMLTERMLMAVVGVTAFFVCMCVYVVLQQRVLWGESQQAQVHASSEEAEC